MFLCNIWRNLFLYDASKIFKKALFQVRNRVIDAINQPLSFTGRCISQTVRFLNDELRPAITKYLTAEATKKVDLDI